MKKIIFAGIILVIALSASWNLIQFNRPMGNPMGILIELLLIVALSIVWVFLPIKLYKKDFIRWFGYFFTGVLLFVILSVSTLFIYEIATCEHCYMVGGYLPFVIIGFLVGVFIVFSLVSKTRKALKELKQENE